jgi:hypothetical protein
MSVAARWIRLQLRGIAAMPAVCAAFARVQARDAAPAALWAGSEGEPHAFAIVAPLKYLPGRSTRWRSWALAPLVATYRQCGLSAYYDADRICLRGQPISGVEASSVGGRAVIVADFAPWGAPFMNLLRARVEAQYGWQFDHSWPTQAETEALAGALAGVLCGMAANAG